MARPQGFDKLSAKWRTYIEVLEKNFDRLEERHAQAVGEADDQTKVRVHDYGITKDQPLPDHALVRFITGPYNDQFIDVQMDRHAKKPTLIVRGGRAVVIDPNAANTFYVRMNEER